VRLALLEAGLLRALRGEVKIKYLLIVDDVDEPVSVVLKSDVVVG
jgi:hypothetical protein